MCHNPENNSNLRCNNILKSHILNNNANAKLEALSLDIDINEDSNFLESYAVSADKQYKFQSTKVPPNSRSSSRMSGESSSSSPSSLLSPSSSLFCSPSCDKFKASWKANSPASAIYCILVNIPQIINDGKLPQMLGAQSPLMTSHKRPTKEPHIITAHT